MSMLLKEITLKVSLTCLLSLLIACSNTSLLTNDSAVQRRNNLLLLELKAKEESLDKREAELQKTTVFRQVQSNNLLPLSSAKPGECYVQIKNPSKFKIITEQVLIKDAFEQIEIIPSIYQWENKAVKTRSASSKFITTPPVYETKVEKIEIRAKQIYWKRIFNHKSTIASDSLIALAKKHGAAIDTAIPGTCFHEHTTPETYSTSLDSFLIKEESETIFAVPADYKVMEKKVIIKNANSKSVTIPATFEEVDEKIILKPAHTVWKTSSKSRNNTTKKAGGMIQLVTIPAEYQTITKEKLNIPAAIKISQVPEEVKIIQVLEEVEPASKRLKFNPPQYKKILTSKKQLDANEVWHATNALDQPRSTRTGQKICLVEEPAVYKKIKKSILKVPASVEEIFIPAEYTNVKINALKANSSEKRTLVPATYEKVNHEELVSAEHMEWRPVLCESHLTVERVGEIQQALAKNGFNPGEVDGFMGPQTLRAINDFQKENELPVDGYVNISTLKALNVSVQ